MAESESVTLGETTSVAVINKSRKRKQHTGVHMTPPPGYLNPIQKSLSISLRNTDFLVRQPSRRRDGLYNIRMVNMCPIDNVLTCLSDQFQNNTTFRNSFNDDLSNLELSQCLTRLSQSSTYQNTSVARYLFLDSCSIENFTTFSGNEVNMNFYTSERDITNVIYKQLLESSRLKYCTNSRCSTAPRNIFSQVLDIPINLLNTTMEEPGEFIRREYEQDAFSECTQ
jgi:hypothetical protein